MSVCTVSALIYRMCDPHCGTQCRSSLTQQYMTTDVPKVCLCCAFNFPLTQITCLSSGCQVKLKSVIVQWQRVYCVKSVSVSVCRGSSGDWREASVVTAVIDSHRQVAPSVATGTWTRVSLTYSNNKDRAV